MEQTKGLSCQIPESLHARVTAEPGVSPKRIATRSFISVLRLPYPLRFRSGRSALISRYSADCDCLRQSK